jgi:UrcA family protein
MPKVHFSKCLFRVGFKQGGRDKMDTAKLMSLWAAVAITAGTFAASSPAFGQDSQTTTVTGRHPDVEYVTERVSYSDLNLALPAHEEKLVRRVKYAVNRVCPDYLSQMGFIDRNCRSFAWNGVKPQIDRAVQRAREIAVNGFSSIAPVAITISLPQ